MTSICHGAYLHGYARKPVPRWLRRFIARSEIHRSWLAGWLGFFEQDGVAYGPAVPYSLRLGCDANRDDDVMMEWESDAVMMQKEYGGHPPYYD